MLRFKNSQDFTPGAIWAFLFSWANQRSEKFIFPIVILTSQNVTSETPLFFILYFLVIA